MPLVVVCLLVLLLVAGCGGGGGGASSVARRYEQSIVSRDGDSLCGTFAPKLREVLAEQLTSEQTSAGSTSRPRFDCGAYFHTLIGYPHENIDRQFLKGKVLSVGGAHEVTRAGIVYAKVRAKLGIEFEYTGYSMHSGKRGSKTFEDTVWLSRGKSGRWGVVKPSLALLAGSSPDVLYQSYAVEQANAAPPDPNYSLTRAERTRSEAADYRASFRRQVGHAPLRCGGRSLSVTDPLHDAVTYPTGSALHPAAAPRANDVARVAVQVSGRRMCVTIAFREKPGGDLRVAFTPYSHGYFGEYVVELVPTHGVRGGELTTPYRYFDGGDKLTRRAVGEIALYGRSIAFVADAQIGHPPSGSDLTELTWKVGATAADGSDFVPNAAPGETMVIRQSDGRAVKLGRG